MAAILERVIDVILRVDKQGIIKYISPLGLRWFGDSAPAVKTPFVDILYKDDVAAYNLASDDFPEFFECEVRIIRNDHYSWVHIKAYKLPVVYQYMVCITDISTWKESAVALLHASEHDHLTGLVNRVLLYKTVNDYLDRGVRAFRIALLDLDGFKKVNDTLGHAAGDEVLIETAKRLHKAVGQSDLVARLGGDEFAIIFNGYGSNAAVIKVLDKIIQAMGRPFNTNPHEAFLGVSIGVSNYPEHGEDYATLLKKADTAMYYVKQNGKNSYKIYEEEKEDSNLTLKTGVYKGIQEGQFFLDFQPQFDMQGTIIGAEALMRWDSPEFGTISPEIFIPIVEEAGLMTYLGTWAMRYACHQMGEFRKVKPDFVLSVNVSPIQFEGDALDEFVLSALAEGNIPSESIVLEVPEAVLVASKDKIEQRMSVLCKRGVRFSIDDFGLGMSSLTQLTKLPVHTLKIGKAFLKAIESEASPKFEVEKRFIAALVKLAHSVDLKCVAEGVETKTQLEFLSVCGCDYVQGYLLGKPISGDALVKLLKENR